MISHGLRTLLGIDTLTHEPVYLSNDASMYCLGKPGSGKTTLMKNLIAQDMQQGKGVWSLDFHGDMTTDLLTHHIPPHREMDVILLNLLDPEYAFPLNLFYCVNPLDKQEVSRII